MIPIILSWLYIVFILFATGLLLATVTDHITIALIKGIVVCTFLACVLSLFMPLSAGAGIITLVLALACLYFFRTKARALIVKYRSELQYTSWSLIILFTGYVFVVAYLSCEQPSHYDDGLYYGTTIRWLEEQGIVKGLVNINPRIAFNSTWHVLQALFSFHYVGNFNDLNGLLLLLMMMYSLGGMNRIFKRDYSLSVVMRSLLFVPVAAFHFGASHDFLLFNINYLSSPSADIPVCFLLWIVFVVVIELREVPADKRPANIALICMLSALLFSIKPSAAPVLLLCVFFFGGYVLQKKFEQAAMIAMLSSLIVVPWIVRNIIISGYLFFPFSSLDMIQVDWKLPIQHVKWFENAVKVYAINPEYDLNKPFTLSVQQWFGIWFNRLSFIQSLLFLSGIASIVLFSLLFVAGVMRKGKRFVSEQRYIILCVATAVAGSLFWFLKGPDFRLGYGFTVIITVLSLAMMFRYFLAQDIKYAGIILTIGFFYLMIFHYKGPWKDVATRMKQPLPGRKQPAAIKAMPLGNGMQMQLVNYGDSWYGPLPIANETEYYTLMPVPRGSSVKDGFKASK